MATILLKKARIYDRDTQYHLKQMDVLIEKGIISKIAKNITPPAKAKVVKSKALSVSQGWIDIGTYNGEPGFEYREDLHSLREAALQGGYTGIAPMPTGQPTIDSKGQLHFLMSQGADHIVDIHPIAAITKHREGKEISEMLDLHQGGAIAFSDGDEDHMSEDQLLLAMQYLKTVNGLTIYSACRPTQGHVHEGSVSVAMGIEGIPSHEEVANTTMAIRCSEYADAALLIHNISTAEGLLSIKKATNKGNLSVSVPFLNLLLEDKDVIDFDLNLKVQPPLRSSSDRKALIKAINTGQINIITSNHKPLSLEEKDQPFGDSTSGASTIETVFAGLNTLGSELSTEHMIHCLSNGPREVLGLQKESIKVGQAANLTIFDPEEEVTFDESQIKSKCKNNPLLGRSLRGSILGVIKNTKSTL